MRLSPDFVSKEDADVVPHSCVSQTVTVHGYGEQTLCVMRINGWRYAVFPHSVMVNTVPYNETLFTVSFGSDRELYVVEGMGGSGEPLDNPDGDTIVYANPLNQRVGILRNLPDRLRRTEEGYSLAQPGNELQYADGSPVYTVGAVVAKGGKWLVAETGRGIVRVNLETLETRIVSTFTNATPGRFSGPRQLAISDDGQTIMAAGRPYEPRSFGVITVNDKCGTADAAVLSQNLECPVHDLDGLFADGSLPDGWPLDFSLSPHGKRLDLMVQGSDGRYTRASLYPYGSAPATLRYLALGDSFSAGEGDGDHGYYEPHTDDSATGETCHTSTRSYPFLLASFGALEMFDGPVSFGMKSVACSGAETADIVGSEDSYEGQKGRLKGLPTATLEDRRVTAMNEFIPGRVPQIDFVDEYQPRAVSVGVGGNDVQFADILALCAHTLTTCSYANDPTDRRNVGESIEALYPKLLALYTSVVRADPSSRIVAVGYPLFINETNTLCPLSTNLDFAERTMVDEGVRYINAVTKAAAQSAGIAYVDIADSLVGHRACDDPGGYVNAIDVVGALMGHIDLGTFHPNELGQSAMALAIERQLGGGDIAAHSYCASNHYPCPEPTNPPPLPTFFGDASSRPLSIALPSELVRISGSVLPDIVTRGIEFVLRASQLAAGSMARIELHSDLVNLGLVTVGADGVASALVTIPDTVETGYHTLHLYGSSPSGEAVDMYQIIYVDEKGDDTSGSTPAATMHTDGNVTASSGNLASLDTVSTSQIKHNVVSNTPFSPSPHIMKGWVLPTSVGAIALCVSVTALALWRRRPR